MNKEVGSRLKSLFLDVPVPLHCYNHKFVNALQSLIESNYSHLFYAVIIQGSVATNEIIKYSDFDGLLIVKDEYTESKELKQFKKDSLKCVLEFDPLQHHGWFQIKQSELKKYPEDFLPSIIFRASTLLYPIERNFNLTLKIKDDIDYQKGLKIIITQMMNRVDNNWRPKNIFQLKGFLSQIMLLPALYYSSKNNKGILKKESFNAVKSDFTKEEWSVIQTASDIRSSWDYALNPIQAIIMKQPNRLFRVVTKKVVAPKINQQTKKKLDDSFYFKLHLFLIKIKNNLNY
jgi:hypothetical protein